MKSLCVKKRAVAGILSLVLMTLLSLNGVAAQAAEKMTINHETLSVEVGSVYKLSVKNASGTVTWKSSDAKIAKVSSKGSVTALKAGTATITATAGKISAKCKLTITKSDKLSSVFYKTWVGDIGEVTLTSDNIGEKMYEITADVMAGYPANTYRFTASIKDSSGTTTLYYYASLKENGKVVNDYKFKMTVKGDKMVIYSYSKINGKYSKATTYTKQ